MKIKKHVFVRLFKCSYVLRVVAVIFELDEVSMSNFVKLKFLSMTLTPNLYSGIGSSP